MPDDIFDAGEEVRRRLMPCEHDYEPISSTRTTKQAVMSEMCVGGSPLIERFMDTPSELFVKVCLKCKHVFDEIDNFKNEIEKAIKETDMLKTWAPLRRKRAQEIYLSVQHMRQGG